MKTEVEIDESILRDLKEAAAEAHITFDQVVNRTLTAGLLSVSGKKPAEEKFVTQPHNFGISLDDPKAALARLDEEEDLKKFGIREG